MFSFTFLGLLAMYAIVLGILAKHLRGRERQLEEAPPERGATDRPVTA